MERRSLHGTLLYMEEPGPQKTPRVSPQPARGDLPEPPWRTGSRAREGRRVMKRHRDIARLSLGRIPAGRTLALLNEWLFELLRPVGIPDQVIAYFGDLAGLYVGAYAFEERLGLALPTGEDLPPHEILAMLRNYVLSLPPDRFPHTVSAVDALFGGGRDERFEFGIDVIIRGLETYARAIETQDDGSA